MNNNKDAANNNGSTASNRKPSLRDDEKLVVLTQEKVEQTRQRVKQVHDRLATQRRSLLLCHLRDQYRFERCLRQQEAMKFQRTKLLAVLGGT